MQYRIDDTRIRAIQEVIPPRQLHEEIPLTDSGARTIFEARNSIHKILHGEDDRLLVIMGPCSIHDPEAAREYAQRLKALLPRVEKEICLVMRVY
ncbi:MAG: 3-deoxy-7-phosphoheptulonate synthase, partial [Gammaproteobacteria bacterium]|nr:3-deoxy-7-phosphoheptulonate synthase [Gammaproteobacteria bacterium]